MATRGKHRTDCRPTSPHLFHSFKLAYSQYSASSNTFSITSEKMRLTASRVYSRSPPVPKMPPGLVELMEGLTKDVLKNNPPDVYEFCAEHMRKLLEIRDGPSNKKPLSLEQKILRAQEKVRRRAEQRWRIIDEELKLQDKKLDCENQIGKAITNNADEKAAPSVVKPVQHTDLTQASEIEISCEPDNTDSFQNLNDAKGDGKQIFTSVEGENITSYDVQQTKIPEDTSNDLTNKLDSTNFTKRHPNEDDDDLTTKLLDNTKKLDVSVVQSCGENIDDSKGDSKPIDDIVDGSVNDANEIGKTVTNGIEKVSNLEHSNVEIAVDTRTDAQDNVDEIQSGSFFELPDNEINDSNKLTESTKTKENKEIISLETSETHITNDHIISNDDTNITECKIMDDKNVSALELEQYVKNTEVIVSESAVHIPMSYTDLTTDIEETNNDLEKVMNDAIENTKRKDSSADDSFKDNIVFHDESDASEGSGLIHKNETTISEVVEDRGNSIVKNEDINHLIETVNEATSEMRDTADIELNRSKRSLDGKNTNHSSISENVADTTNVLDDSSTITIPSDSIKEDNNANELNKSEKHDIASTMDLETAAVTIQKVFRTFLFKSRASTFEESVNEDNNLSDDDDKKEDVFVPANTLNKERRTLGISRMDTVLQTVNEEKSLSLSTDDSSLSSAATIIQAHVRGFLLRNKMNSGKSVSKNSLGISNGPSSTSMDGDMDQNKGKTVLNIHIVPEGGNYLSRDESMITSMDLSLDGSPPSSVNLHPLGYNKSERRKQLKREDAVQSVSPPSNNSGKLSEDVDSVKELPINEQDSNLTQEQKITAVSMLKEDSHQDTEVGSLETTPTTSLTAETVIGEQKTPNTDIMSSPELITETPDETKKSLTKQSSDEMDVITPFKENSGSGDTKLLHSGEFHDTALPTKVSRSDTPVVSEFKNVLVYFLIWNNS